MNKIIHELALYAGLYCDGTPDSFDTEAVEAFATLWTKYLIEQVYNALTDDPDQAAVMGYYNAMTAMNLALEKAAK